MELYLDIGSLILGLGVGAGAVMLVMAMCESVRAAGAALGPPPEDPSVFAAKMARAFEDARKALKSNGVAR